VARGLRLMMRSCPIDPRGALLWCLALWIIRVVTWRMPDMPDA